MSLAYGVGRNVKNATSKSGGWPGNRHAVQIQFSVLGLANKPPRAEEKQVPCTEIFKKWLTLEYLAWNCIHLRRFR